MPSRAKKENTERIHKILSIVRHRGGATMQDLMQELEVSLSTIKRDIAVLR